MTNTVLLVGRIANDLTLIEEGEKKSCIITLSILRNGEYKCDFIECTLINDMASKTCEYCKKCDLVGIKGRLQCDEGKLEVVAEKVTFLSSKTN